MNPEELVEDIMRITRPRYHGGFIFHKDDPRRQLVYSDASRSDRTPLKDELEMLCMTTEKGEQVPTK